MTSRWIELTWQPPSNADGLGNDLLGYRVYVEELCDHLTIVSSKKRNRMLGSGGRGGRSGGQFEDDVAEAAGGFGGLKRGRSSGSSSEECRTIPPETVHGASVTLANFENLGKLILTQFSISKILLSLDFMAIFFFLKLPSKISNSRYVIYGHWSRITSNNGPD